MRDVPDAILYVCREGCSWRAVPHDLPHRKTARNVFRRFAADGTLDRILRTVRGRLRRRPGRPTTPSGACVDSRSAKTSGGGRDVGIDGGKSGRGRKRHVAVDTAGLFLTVVVTAAGADDGTTAPRVPERLPAREFPRPEVVRADAEYRNRRPEKWSAGQDRLRVEVCDRPPGAEGFAPLPGRWVAEQFFGGLIRHRRLLRGHERRTYTSEAMVKVAALHRMLRRLRPPSPAPVFHYARKAA